MLTHTHTHVHFYIHIYMHTHTYIQVRRTGQKGSADLWTHAGVPNTVPNLSKKEPYVMKLVREFDDKLQLSKLFCWVNYFGEEIILVVSKIF